MQLIVITIMTMNENDEWERGSEKGKGTVIYLLAEGRAV